jgi:hypothetical protein
MSDRRSTGDYLSRWNGRRGILGFAERVSVQTIYFFDTIASTVSATLRANSGVSAVA